MTIPASNKRKKRDELRTDGSDKIPQDAPSAEDDAIDAAIKRSIDQFGA